MPVAKQTIDKEQLTIYKFWSNVKCQMSNVQRKTNGFTLIELLVVISIIAILITVIVATFGTTQQKARDSNRKTDLDALKKALELHKSDTRGSSWYPWCAGDVGISQNPLNGCNIIDRDSFSPELKVVYIKEIPTDSSTGIGYWYHPSSCDTVNNNGCKNYELTACLENANDADQDTDPIDPDQFLVHSQCVDIGDEDEEASYTITNP